MRGAVMLFSFSARVRYMTSMQQLSTSPRTMKDLKRALEFVTPESMKKARFISAYPSDPL